MKKTTIYRSPFDHVEYGLFTDEKAYKRYCKKHKLPFSYFIKKDKNAAAHHYEHSNGDAASFVCIEKHDLDNAVIALIVHEAVHIWQFVCERMGEDKPSPEFEAYSIQQITQNLLTAYQQQTEINKEKS